MLFDIPLVVNRMGGNPDPLNGAGQHPLERRFNASWVWRTRSILRVTRILRLMRLVRLYQRYKVPAPPCDGMLWQGPGQWACSACMAAQGRPCVEADLLSPWKNRQRGVARGAACSVGQALGPCWAVYAC